LITEEQQQNKQNVKELLSCYHVQEGARDEDYPHDIQIEEVEGERDVEGPPIELEVISTPININKFNIRTTEHPKMASIGDYPDEKTIESITELLHEYSDLFPTTFTEMKGIARELGEMKISLRPEVRPIRQRTYRLNPIYKQKVKDDIDRMIEAGIIEPIKESEWISPMAVQEKKQGRGIKICIDLRKLNDACLHDLFPTLFTDEVLENMGGHEYYSFTDAFSGYHQIKIAQEDRHKTMFAIEWGSYQYTVMPFGLKNAPTIFSRVVIATFKEFIHQFIEVYLDDWTVYNLLKKYVEVLRLMLERCRQCQISLNIKKCIFVTLFVILLGYMVCK
jgi:hypothetical protein